MAHTVLLVDDDPDLISALRLALRKQEFNVRCASSAEQALKVLQTSEIDLVVSDIEMPGMKGIEFLSKLQTEHPSVTRYILTGNASLESAIQAINKGAVSRFFVKPCDSAELAASINAALQHKELSRQARRLLKKVHRQDAILNQIERIHPGITNVARTDTGSIILSSDIKDDEALVRKLKEMLSDEP